MQLRPPYSRVLSGFSRYESGVSLAIVHRLVCRLDWKIEVFSSLSGAHLVHPHRVKKLTDSESAALEDELLSPSVWTRHEVRILRSRTKGAR